LVPTNRGVGEIGISGNRKMLRTTKKRTQDRPARPQMLFTFNMNFFKREKQQKRKSQNGKCGDLVEVRTVEGADGGSETSAQRFPARRKSQRKKKEKTTDQKAAVKQTY